MSVTTYAVELDATTAERLAHLAKESQLTPEGLAANVVTAYVENQRSRSAFYAEAMAAWQTYKEDGLHLTQAEMMLWVNALAQDPDAPMPVCHL